MITLATPDPAWPAMARAEIRRWHGLEGLITIHHVGSTSVAGLIAKPVIDLLPVFDSVRLMDAARGPLESLEYEWMGPFGIPGRRYVRRNDPITGKRIFQAHCYAKDSPEILRHVGFRDLLRESEDLRTGYADVKRRCAAAHPEDMGDCTDCKSAWIQKTEAKIPT